MSEIKDNPLHVLILDAADGTYNKETGELNLPYSQTIQLTVAEYEDERKRIAEEVQKQMDEAMKITNQKLKPINQERLKSYEFIQKSVERYERGEISYETHDANIRAREKSEESRNQSSKKIKDEYEERCEQLQRQADLKLQALKDQYANLRWIRSLVGISPPHFAPEDYNHRIGKGNLVLTLAPGEYLEGGGAVYLEPFLEGDRPQSKAPHGIFLTANGTPEVIHVDWETAQGEKIPPETKVAFGSVVYLSIYTQGLYGRNIKIQLKDRDLFLRIFSMLSLEDDDNLYAIPKETVAVIQDPEIAKEEGKYFHRPVDVYKTHLTVPKNAKIGNIYINETEESYVAVQKSYFSVYIDHFWRASAGNELEIYPIVYNPFTGAELSNGAFKGGRLKVSADREAQLMEGPKEIESNQPYIYGQVETNIAFFSHCRYTSIELYDGTKYRTIFTSDNPRLREKQNLDIEIIGGETKRVELIFDFETLECEHSPSHNEKELEIISYPSSYTLLEKGSLPSPRASDDIIVIGKKSPDSSKTKIFGVSHTQSTNIPKDKHESVSIGDYNNVVLDAFYHYNLPDESSVFQIFPMLMDYFWLPNMEAMVKPIAIKTHTCALSQQVNVRIVPDIQWTLKLGFNLSKEFVEKLGNKRIFAPLKEYQMQVDQANKNLSKKDEAFLKNTQWNRIRYSVADDFTKANNLPKKPKKSKKTEEKKKDNVKKGGWEKLWEIITNVNISLTETHYGGKVTNEISSEMVANVYNYFKPVFNFIANARSIINGESDSIPEDEFLKLIYRSNNERDRQSLLKFLKRKPQEYELTYPQLALVGSWAYEEVDAKSLNRPDLESRVGLGVHLEFEAAPLLGISIKWDLLELLCRRHPIAFTVLKALDAVRYITYDKSDLILNFTVSGTIDTSIAWDYNFLAGAKKLETKSKGSLQLKLELKVYSENQWNVIGYEVVIAHGYGASTQVGLGMTTLFGIDTEGVYIENILEFEGLKIDVDAISKLVFKKEKIPNNRKEEDKEILDISINPKYTTTLGAVSHSAGKFYLNKKVKI